MRKEIFAITIFEDTVDLDKIVVPYKDEQLEPTWDSGVPSAFGSQKGVPESTYAYLSEVVNRNLGPAQLMGQMLHLATCGPINMVKMTIRMHICIQIVSGVLLYTLMYMLRLHFLIPH